MRKKKVLVVTGIRSEYDILYPVLNELRDGNFDIKIIVSGAHLSDHFGNTVERINDDGFVISDRIDSLFITSRLIQRAKGAGLLIYGLSQAVERENPDFLMVVGDREESIGTAVVGNYMDKLVVHIGGGDSVYGNADDPVRFAVSKLAHIHCCFSKEYADNLLNLSENSFRVFNTGNPAFVNIENTKKINVKLLSNLINVDLIKDRYIVVIKHPLSSELVEAYSQINTTLKSVEKFCRANNFKALIISPNSDPGSEEIRLAISEFNNSTYIYPLETLKRATFINVIRNCRALVGNSSMGILEAPYYKLPVVNIGNRQKGRMNAGNVDFVPYNENKIIRCIEKACFDKKYRANIQKIKNPFGDSNSAKKIRKVLEMVDLDDRRWFVKDKLC